MKKHLIVVAMIMGAGLWMLPSATIADEMIEEAVIEEHASEQMDEAAVEYGQEDEEMADDAGVEEEPEEEGMADY